MAFQYSRALTNAILPGADLANFPMLVSAVYPWLRTVGNGGHVQSASGFDIVFATDPFGVTRLNFERVTWDPTTGACEFWVQIPTLSSSVATVIYIAYGDATVITDQQNRNGTWDANYVAVWHFGNGAALDLTDSTANGFNLINNNVVTAGARIIGGAGGGSASFSRAASQFLDAGNPAALQLTGALFIEATAQPASLPSASQIPVVVSKLDASNGFALFLNANVGGSARLWIYEMKRAGSAKDDIGTLGVIGTPVALAGVGNGVNAFDLYENGALQDVGNFAGAGNTPVNFIIGNAAFLAGLGFNGFWDGLIDEVRVSNSGRSQVYAISSGATTTSPGTFYTVGPENNHGIGSFALVTQSAIELITLNTNTAARVTQSAIELLTLPGLPSVTCNSPQAAMIGQFYNHIFPAVGGVPPYVFSISAGALPPGLSINSVGLVSGIPTTAVGVFHFTVQVVDSAANVASVACSITVQPPAVVITLRGVKRRKVESEPESSEVPELPSVPRAV